MNKLLLTLYILFQGFTYMQAQSRTYKFHPSTRKEDYMPHTIVVRYKAEAFKKGVGNSQHFKPVFSTAMQKLGIQESRQRFNWKKPANKPKLRKQTNGSTFSDLALIHQITIPASIDLEKAINLLLADPDIAYAEPIYTKITPLHIPNDTYADPPAGDPYAGSFYAGKQYYLSTIKAYEAWDIQKGNPDVTIGIIDYGTDVNHEDLKDNIQYNLGEDGLDEFGDDKRTNGKDDDEDGYIDNYAGWNAVRDNGDLKEDTHGTRVAGCASGTPDNGKGIAGVGYNCKFIPVTAYEVNHPYFYGWDGINYALEKGVKIINLSYTSGQAYSQAEQDYLNVLVNEYDVVFVVAAGNTNGEYNFYPASYDNVISVGASDAYDLKANFATYSSKIDIVAPGYLVQSTIDNSLVAGGYGADNGSSYAAPIVAGAAALVRSQFPNLTALEVIERLQATADNIYDLPGNAAYAGKLGKGRLNVYRAVTEMVRITQTTINGYNGQPYLWAGQEASISFDYSNHVNAINDLQITFSTTSPYVNILDDEAVIGPVAVHEPFSQSGDPFRIEVKPSTPINTYVTFKITYTDGDHTGFNYVNFLLNPDYVDIDVNMLKLTATSRGRIGYNGNTVSDGGIGINYNGQDLVEEAGLMLGVSATKVSNCVKDNSGGASKDNHFSTHQQVWFNSANDADLSAGGIFTDTVNNADKIGLAVTHQAYAWQDTPNDKFVIVEYKIKNVRDNAIPSLYAGMFADWNIQGNFNNTVQWDATNNLGYVYNNTTNNLYAGLQLLTAQTPHYQALDDVSGTNIYDGFSTAEKYAALSSALTRTQSANGATDVAHTLTAQIQNLQAGETRIVAFAFLVGNTLNDLKANAQAAKNKFIQIKTGPVPVLANINACANTSTVLAPSNGSQFKLYGSFPLSTPIASGSTFNLGMVTKDSTYYLTNIDSLFESQPLTLEIKSIKHKTDFSTAKDTIALLEQENLQTTDKTAGAVKWRWDFGDNAISTQQHTSHTYTDPGKYTVKLVTENSNGCQDSLTKEILVIQGRKSVTPDVTAIQACMNEGITIEPTNGTNFNFYNSWPLTSPVAQGKSFFIGDISRDTVFYVTSTDYILESDPATVDVKVTTVKADFIASTDTISLYDKESITLTDKSANAIKWFWDFGDGETSTKQNPVYTYTEPGDYTIKLVTQNSSGCKDSLMIDVMVVGGIHSLKPGISDMNVCENAMIILAPTNGEIFNFYDQLPLTTPVATGKTFKIGYAEKDTVLYVTGADFLFESEPVTVKVKVSGMQTNFSISDDTLNLEQNQLLQVTDKSTAAVKWLWDFGDGNTSTEQNPTHLYANTGKYIVSLESENNMGCQESLMRSVTVVRTTGIEEDLSIFVQLHPNPTQGKLYLQVDKNAFLAKTMQVELYSQLGQQVYNQAIQGSNYLFNFSHLAKGVYMMRVTSGNHQMLKKIVLY